MSRAVTEFDWAATPLGPISGWPAALKTAAGMMLSSHFPKAITWGPELITLYNTAFIPILGNKHVALGQSFADIWAEAWEEIGPIAEKAMAGKATFIEDFPLVIDRSGQEEQCYFTFCYSPIYDEHGSVGGMIDTVMETTSKVKTQQQSEILNRELQHRIKNMLSTISAISSQTLRNADNLDQAAKALQSRIMALSSAHEKVTQGRSGRASIHEVVRGATRPHAGDTGQTVIEGPDILLNERQALALSLAVNELATNAIKYGALSVPDGRIEARWGVTQGADGTPVFSFVWKESNGPAVVPPERKGFGSTLIGRVVPMDFDGTAEIDYAGTGLTYRLETGLDKLDSPAAEHFSGDDPDFQL